jgi:hypothetical protein
MNSKQHLQILLEDCFIRKPIGMNDWIKNCGIAYNSAEKEVNMK